MKKTVLLIDSNLAVQAITSLALNRIGISVEQLTDPSAAASRVRELRPQLILCATDMKGVDAYELCREMKHDKNLQKIPFVVLAGGEQGKDATLEKLVDATIYKPFKSDQLRQVVQRLLSDTEEELQESDTVAVLLQDKLCRAIVERYLVKNEREFVVFKSVEELQTAAKKRSFALTVVDLSAKQEVKWFDSKLMGPLVIITYDARGSERTDLPQEARIVIRPLSLPKMREVFSNFFPDRMRAADAEEEPLEKAEQAVLAAKISVAVYQRLLNQDALKNRSWEEASAAVGAEALRICLEQDS